MGKVTHVLKSEDVYLMIPPFEGSRSVHTTSDILDCTHFKSPAHAAEFLKYISALPDDFTMNSQVNFQDVTIVKATLNITEEPINFD
ncbi:hypothetical protein RG959_22515 [Domibacillus sp. 8LH]|uniref:hypothetical protein n=1 Tax=Domibacillus sp. 8LH TaxID=3073900 RepID=UPI00317D662C